MTVLVAPNAFRGVMDAEQIARILAGAVIDVGGLGDAVTRPLADGGDGFLQVVAGLRSVQQHVVRVANPRGEPVDAAYLFEASTATAYLEMAEASGMKTLAEPLEDDVMLRDTRGLGALILAALAHRPRSLVLGVGGSATVDMGAGALHALGVVFRDKEGRTLEPKPRALQALESVDVSGLDSRLSETEICILADVHSTPRACIRLYGPQKGLHRDDFYPCELAFQRLADALFHSPGLLDRPMYGAAGAVVAGLAGVLGAQVQPGAPAILGLSDIPTLLQQVDLVITGEGKLDQTSFEGKAPWALIQAAHQAGKPTLLIAGRIDERAKKKLPHSVTAVALSRANEDQSLAKAETAERLAESGRRLLKAFIARKGRLRDQACGKAAKADP